MGSNCPVQRVVPFCNNVHGDISSGYDQMYLQVDNTTHRQNKGSTSLRLLLLQIFAVSSISTRTIRFTLGMLVILTPLLFLSSIYLATHLVPFLTAVPLTVSPFYDKSSKKVPFAI